MDDLRDGTAIGAIPSYAARPAISLVTSLEPGALRVRQGQATLALLGTGRDPDGVAVLDAAPLPEREPGRRALMAALETLFVSGRIERVRVRAGTQPALRQACLAQGAALADGAADLLVPAELFWQRSELWLPPGPREPFPLVQVQASGYRHPLRPPKPEGLVYARFIPWLDRLLTFRTLDPESDLERFHRWMNDPRVERIWSEGGDLDQHQAYLAKLAADPHMLPLIASLDGVPFAYFELYWAKENRLGPYYEALDHDRGWHVLVGEDAFRGKPFVRAWLPSLMHFMFLDDPRTRWIVGEPAASHAQQIRNLERAGFAKVKHVAFPHKRAMLVMLSRERFFVDRLWAAEEGEARDGQAKDGLDAG